MHVNAETIRDFVSQEIAIVIAAAARVIPKQRGTVPLLNGVP